MNITGSDDARIGLKDTTNTNTFEWISIDRNGIVSSNSQYWAQINQAIMVIVLKFGMHLLYVELDLMIYHVHMWKTKKFIYM